MSDSRLGAFIHGVDETLTMMVGIEPAEVDTHSPLPRVDISGSIRLKGDNEGQVTLCFPRDTAKNVVGRMLGLGEADLDDETLGDGVGELTNIVAGNAKRHLAASGRSFAISLPSITIGSDHRTELHRAAKSARARLTTACGEIGLLIWFSKQDEGD